MLIIMGTGSLELGPPNPTVRPYQLRRVRGDNCPCQAVQGDIPRFAFPPTTLNSAATVTCKADSTGMCRPAGRLRRQTPFSRRVLQNGTHVEHRWPSSSTWHVLGGSGPWATRSILGPSPRNLAAGRVAPKVLGTYL